MNRTARIFISSTFRDFGEERDLLVRKVFPGLRARLQERFVDLVDVDLRWGITAEQAERGEVLPVCLAEIDRARPWFVGLLGERYGWIPPGDRYPSHVLAAQPWLESHRGGKSVTELEILHGVLNDPKMAGRALFYFRSPSYATAKGGDYLPASGDDASRQADLKDRIRASGFPVVEDYADPQALAARLEADLWAILDATFPPDDVPDAFERESMRHEAHAAPRRGLYMGGEAYLEALEEALTSGQQRILVRGQSGGGKSALLANWVGDLCKRHGDIVLHTHYLGATADASDPVSLVRRLIEAIKRIVGSEESLPADPEELLEALPIWLGNASAWAGMQGKRLVFVIDGLNGLSSRRDLRWFPAYLPARVHLVVSCLEGPILEQLETKGDWRGVTVRPLTLDEARKLLVAYLARFNKVLAEDLLSQVMGHPLVANPLFLRTLAEELRLFGVHEELKARIDHYLESKTVDDLFEKVLARVEHDSGAAPVRQAMLGLWASRAGLSDEEVQGYANLKPAEWATIRHALGSALVESAGNIVFGHDYLRIAVSDRYMAGNNTLAKETQSEEARALRREAHARLARWFELAFEDEDGSEGRDMEGKSTSVEDYHAAMMLVRAAREIPHQWREAEDWPALNAALTRWENFWATDDIRIHTEEELLSFWLTLEANRDTRLEEAYVY